MFLCSREKKQLSKKTPAVISSDFLRISNDLIRFRYSLDGHLALSKLSHSGRRKWISGRLNGVFMLWHKYFSDFYYVDQSSGDYQVILSPVNIYHIEFMKSYTTLSFKFVGRGTCVKEQQVKDGKVFVLLKARRIFMFTFHLKCFYFRCALN